MTTFEYPTVAFELAHLALILLVMNIHLVYKPLINESPLPILSRGNMWGRGAGMDSQG